MSISNIFNEDSLYDDINFRHNNNVLLNDMWHARTQRDLTPLESRCLDHITSLKHKLNEGI